MPYPHSARGYTCKPCRGVVTSSADTVWLMDNAVTYSADAVGVMFLHIGPDSAVHSTPPALHPPLGIMGSGVAGLLAQVVELEGDLILGIQDPSIAKVTMLCD